MQASIRLFAAAAAVAVSLACGSAAKADDGAAYEPSRGEEVVVYTHHFKPETFDAGLKLVEEGMVAAQRDAKQIRKNEILIDREHSTVVLISYFSPQSDVEAWHNYQGRLDLLDKLHPLWREEQTVERFKFEALTRSP